MVQQGGLDIVAEPVAADALTAGAVPDSLTADSVPAWHGLSYGITIERPAQPEALAAQQGGNGMSWLLAAMILLFVVAALRYRKNSRFLSLMLRDVVEIRERHNAFDDTLRETAFLWLLNLLWCGAAGILLYGFLFRPEAGIQPGPDEIRRIGVCIGMAGAYTIFLTGAYGAVGNLFSDAAKASLWVKGYLSSQALEAVILFPVALLGLCLPGILGAMLVTGGIVFIFAKLLFVYKGFCIFFSRIASLVLFLYYLCSLEIVPIVLTYVSTKYFCGLI